MITLSTGQLLLLALAAALAGVLNSVAGGGSFITFPALIFSGVAPVSANITSTVALWPGSVASAGAYRRELAQQDRSFVVVLALASLVGGFLGAVLLLNTPQATFKLLIPFLLLFATLLFTFGRSITRRLRAAGLTPTQGSLLSLAIVAVLQLIIALYGGYFGGGIGILMLATLSFFGMDNLHAMNAIKTVLATFINGVAVVTFILAGNVLWTAAIAMVVGALAGGYGGAALARRIDPRIVRFFVIAVGTVLTVYFLIHG
ncbi:MAG: sulfite exporter TauE/SafE family protein [Chloroflexi bacterium]|nr:sulfite exporter TauE/SafE family protein [Chloroflexota bacterium]